MHDCVHRQIRRHFEHVLIKATRCAHTMQKSIFVVRLEVCLINCLINNRLFITYNCERRSKKSIVLAKSTKSKNFVFKKSSSLEMLKNSNKHVNHKQQIDIAKIFVFAFMKMTFFDKNQVIVM